MIDYDRELADAGLFECDECGAVRYIKDSHRLPDLSRLMVEDRFRLVCDDCEFLIRKRDEEWKAEDAADPVTYRSDDDLHECDSCACTFNIEDLHSRQSVREVHSRYFGTREWTENRRLCDECAESFDTRSYRLNRNTIVGFAVIALLNALGMLYVLAASEPNPITVIAAIYLLVTLAALGRLAVIWRGVRREYPLRESRDGRRRRYLKTAAAALIPVIAILYFVWVNAASWHCYKLDYTPWNAPVSEGHCKW
jgi:hypothetical protein